MEQVYRIDKQKIIFKHLNMCCQIFKGNRVASFLEKAEIPLLEVRCF